MVSDSRAFEQHQSSFDLQSRENIKVMYEDNGSIQTINLLFMDWGYGRTNEVSYWILQFYGNAI